jgi:hypothetical protein
MTDFSNLEALRAQAARHAQLDFVRVRRQQLLRQTLRDLSGLLLEFTLGNPATAIKQPSKGNV